MAHSLSAKKRICQNLRRRTRNKADTTRLRTLSKKLRAAVSEKQTEEAQKLLRAAYKLYDEAASKGVIHPRAAARYKSRLSTLLNAPQT